jgi:SET domain-containing protein
MPGSFLIHRARLGASAISGNGLICSEPIRAGEVIAAFGGSVVGRDEIERLTPERRVRAVQIDDDLFLAAAGHAEPARSINHSCRPNCVVDGTATLVARRDIAVGEELTLDYATRTGSDIDEFECACADHDCRGKVTGHDWMLPELQLRYRGFFSPYLARRISDLVAVGAERRAFAL